MRRIASFWRAVQPLFASAISLAILIGLVLVACATWFVIVIATALIATNLPSPFDGLTALIGFIGGLGLAAIIIIVGYRRLVGPRGLVDVVEPGGRARPVPTVTSTASLLARVAEADAGLAPPDDAGPPPVEDRG